MLLNNGHMGERLVHSYLQPSSKQRRVVVTGLGVVSPIGCELNEAWNAALEGKSGVTKLQDDGYKNLPCQVAALVPNRKTIIENNFSKTELKTMAPATAYALLATHEALQMAKWLPKAEEEKQATGVAIGMGMIDLTDVCETSEALKKAYNRVSPFFVPRILLNMAAGQISIKYGFRGPNHAVSTACATGAHAIGDAFRFIQRSDADVMVCGGTEACVSPLSIAAFCRLRALSTSYNDLPTKASRPFDKSRDGFVMGEGAAILVLEELSHAKARGVHIFAEILGYGLSGDASHLTAPSEDGTGAVLAMSRALKDANLKPQDITYINAHATSTPVGDAIESKAIKTLFGSHAKNLAVSSTKSTHGHLLGAAGNLEASFTIMACSRGWIPPTINIESLDDSMDLNYVPNEKQQWSTSGRRTALKNAFGFGGTNASLCIAEYKEE